MYRKSLSMFILYHAEALFRLDYCHFVQEILHLLSLNQPFYAN